MSIYWEAGALFLSRIKELWINSFNRKVISLKCPPKYSHRLPRSPLTVLVSTLFSHNVSAEYIVELYRGERFDWERSTHSEKTQLTNALLDIPRRREIPASRSCVTMTKITVIIDWSACNHTLRHRVCESRKKLPRLPESIKCSPGNRPWNRYIAY